MRRNIFAAIASAALLAFVVFTFYAFGLLPGLALLMVLLVTAPAAANSIFNKTRKQESAFSLEVAPFGDSPTNPIVPKLKRARRPYSPPPASPKLITAKRHTPRVTDVTIDSICAIEWKQFELLCCCYLEWLGYAAGRTPKMTGSGADGGIDIISSSPRLVAQCKSWSDPVGVAQVREFLGAMADRGAGSAGYFFSANGFTTDAADFCLKHKITMVLAEDIHKAFYNTSIDHQNNCRDLVFTPDCRIPTCPNCDIKLIKKGKLRKFWGCTRFPRCQTRIYISLVRSWY